MLLPVGHPSEAVALFLLPGDPDPYAFQILTEDELSCDTRAVALGDDSGAGYDANYVGPGR